LCVNRIAIEQRSLIYNRLSCQFACRMHERLSECVRGIPQITKWDCGRNGRTKWRSSPAWQGWIEITRQM